MSDKLTDDDKPADEKTKEPSFEGDFDADRAQRAITSLREEVAQLKERTAAITAERDEFKAAAEKTGTDRDKALTEALERAEKAERTLAITDAGLPDDVVEEFSDYLTGTPEEVAAKAKRLAARLTPAPKEDEPKDGSADDGDGSDDGLPARPAPKLQPGHSGGDDSADVDEAALIAANSSRR